MGSLSATQVGLAGAVRKTLTVAALAGGLLAASAAAAGPRGGHGDSFHVWVDVIDVDPIVRVDHVDEPVERCVEARPGRRTGWREASGRRYRDDWREPPRERAGGGGAVLGGIVGGLIGNRIGDGRGKETELTVAGALLGATLGASAGGRRDPYDRYDRHERRSGSWRPEPVRRCEVTWESRPVERIEGYEVVYRYAGRRFTKIVDEHPGERMRVRVDLAPV